MTPGQGSSGEQPELDGYEEVISRARAGVCALPTEKLVRIRALLEQALAAAQPGAADLEALARELSDGA